MARVYDKQKFMRSLILYDWWTQPDLNKVEKTVTKYEGEDPKTFK